jgi:hypothetical protein
MKYAIEMGLDAVLYMPSLIKIGSDIQNLIGGGGHAYGEHSDFICLLLFLEKYGKSKGI